MAQIDLITGFLGSGKTTFIRKYAKLLIDKGQKIGIIENDFAAINVDMLLLQELSGEKCELEMVFGNNDRETYHRRLKTKLISMGMRGFERILIEPSGVFDVEEFYDILEEEPLERWYSIGSVITIVDAGLDFDGLSKESKYLLTTQVAGAGTVLLSRSEHLSDTDKEQVVGKINEVIAEFGNGFQLNTDTVICGWSSEDDLTTTKIINSGYRSESVPKLWFEEKEAFQSLYFLNLSFEVSKLEEILDTLFQKEEYGKIHRIKGLVRSGEHWISLNATVKDRNLEEMDAGQEVLIVIGENLQKDKIEAYLEGKNGNI